MVCWVVTDFKPDDRNYTGVKSIYNWQSIKFFIYNWKVQRNFLWKNSTNIYKECICSLTFLLPRNFAVFDCLYFLSIACKELETAQTAEINQLFQLLGDVFYRLTCMLISKKVNNEVSRDSLAYTEGTSWAGFYRQLSIWKWMYLRVASWLLALFLVHKVCPDIFHNVSAV